MRTLTVDTRGLFFTLRMLVVVGLFASVWYAWTALQQNPALDAQTASAIAHSIQEENKTLGAVYEGEGESEAMLPPVTSEPSLYIDLSTNTVSLKQDGELLAVVPIEAVPLHDTPNALQGGSYTVDLVEESQLSVVTLTRFPYYIKFGDRYALHGTPESTQAGESVDNLSGGSLQLKTSDAKTIFEHIVPGSSVVVYTTVGGDEVDAGEEQLKLQSADMPATSAPSYAVTDMETGQTYITKNGGERYPIASITKLLTSLVASEVIEVGTDVRAASGQYYAVGDLYYPLLLRSDNGVARSLANHVGANTFIATMNTQAKALGMHDTTFADSSGLSPKNVSSANDLTLLARYLYTSKRFILDIASEESMTITSVAGLQWDMTNQNKLSSDPHFRGGKLGYTDEAGQTSLALFTLPLAGETHLVSVVVLGSKDWKQDTRSLLRWLVQSTSTSE